MTADLLDDRDVVRVRMPYGRPWTWDDLQEIADDRHRYEIIDGSLHVSPGPSRPHQVAASRLLRLLADAAPGDVEVVETVDIELSGDVLQPDVVVMPAPVAHVAGPPLAPEQVLLAVEVVSPSSRRMDRTVKPSILAEHGVRAYWRVETDGPGAPAVVVHAPADGGYREVVTVLAGETATVDVPFVVELRPAELAGPRRRD